MALDESGFKFTHKNACITACKYACKNASVHLVPIAVPDVCSLTVPLNSNTLFLRTNSAIFKSFSVGIYLFSPPSRSFLRAFNPATLGMQRYNSTTSAVTMIASFGMFSVLFILSLKALESLI